MENSIHDKKNLGISLNIDTICFPGIVTTIHKCLSNKNLLFIVILCIQVILKTTET